MQAKDLPDVYVLRTIEQLEQDTYASTLSTTLVYRRISEAFPQVPFKVVAAKLKKLVERGLIDGCSCGCRGDWELAYMRPMRGMHPPLWIQNEVSAWL